MMQNTVHCAFAPGHGCRHDLPFPFGRHAGPTGETDSASEKCLPSFPPHYLSVSFKEQIKTQEKKENSVMWELSLEPEAEPISPHVSNVSFLTLLSLPHPTLSHTLSVLPALY